MKVQKHNQGKWRKQLTELLELVPKSAIKRVGDLQEAESRKVTKDDQMWKRLTINVSW